MSRKTLHRVWLAAFLAIAAIASARAQRSLAEPIVATASPAAQGAAEERPPQDGGPLSNKSLFEIIQDGGVLMVPFFLCSFITLVFVFERAISLRRGRVIPRAFVKRFLHQIREGKLDRDQAADLCQESASPVAEVFAAAVRKWGRPSIELEQTIIDAVERVSGGLRKYVRLFNAVATISPLMGLLGTVFGMIRLFNAIAHADAMGRTELLAAGISEALFATAAGLLIAIPALCFYLLFVGRVERLLMDIDNLGQELVGLISAEALHDDRHAKARAKSRPPAAA
jgi:biopolymer transport protein ExbB